LGEVLGVDRSLAWFTHRAVVEFLANFAEMVERCFQMAAFMLLEGGSQGLQSTVAMFDGGMVRQIVEALILRC
jgi:hypothetical protein